MAVYPALVLGSGPIGDSDLRYHHIPGTLHGGGKARRLIMVTVIAAIIDNVVVTDCQARLFSTKSTFSVIEINPNRGIL